MGTLEGEINEKIIHTEDDEESKKLTLDEISNEKLEENIEEDTESSTQNSEWQDLLGSGIILKKVLKEGENPDLKPTSSNKCIINYTCRLDEADEDNVVEKMENFELNLGEGDVVQGLDVAITLMNKHERSLLKIGSRLAFGDKGLMPHIPGNSTVVFDVELVDFQSEDDSETMNLKERQKLGNKKRERGNWWYQRGENTLAIQCYRRALNYLDEVEGENLDGEEKPTDKELQKLLEDRLKVLNNMASAQIKLELFDQALTSLETVLRCQPENAKALFRKARIYSVKNNLQQALKLLEKARKLEPEDPLISKEINSISNLINKQKNSEREYARRMFGGGGVTNNNSAGNNSSKNKTCSKKTKKSSKMQVWATLGATAMVGLAGAIAYKLKYT